MPSLEAKPLGSPPLIFLIQGTDQGKVRSDPGVPHTCNTGRINPPLPSSDTNCSAPWP